MKNDENTEHATIVLRSLAIITIDLSITYIDKSRWVCLVKPEGRSADCCAEVCGLSKNHKRIPVQDNACTESTTHYIDVIMGAMAPQITSLTTIYSTVYSGADQRKHQSSASLAFVRGIHRWLVNSPHKGPVTRKMFPFDDVIMHWRRLRLRRQWLHIDNDAKHVRKHAVWLTKSGWGGERGIRFYINKWLWCFSCGQTDGRHEPERRRWELCTQWCPEPLQTR